MWAGNETSLDLIGFQVHADLIRSNGQAHPMSPGRLSQGR